MSSSSRLRGLCSSSPGVDALLPLEKRERKLRRLGLSPVPGRDSDVDGREPRLPNQDRRFFFFSGSGSVSFSSATPSSIVVAFVDIESSSLKIEVFWRSRPAFCFACSRSSSVACFKPAWALDFARSSSVACFNLCGNHDLHAIDATPARWQSTRHTG